METVHPFDLQARARLGARALTALLDASRDGLMYFLASWRARPPRADHCLWDCGDGTGRHVDALTLAHIMAGRDPLEAEGAESRLEGWMFRLLDPAGLSWLPPEPWAEPWGRDLLMAGWREGERVAEINWAQRGTLQGLTTRFLATGDERYLRAARRLVDGLLAVALRHPRGLFFPEGYYREGGWRCRQPGLCPGIDEYNAAPIVPAVRLYEATGYEPALRLASGLAEFALYHTSGYLPDGRFRWPAGELEAHFHTRSNFILGVLKLGLVLDRREYVSWARQSYEHAKTWGTEFGWFPEGLGQRHGEICCTTDMIEIALLLGRHVDRRYYADAERFGRNHLLESQLLSLERLRAAVAALPPSDEPPPWQGRYSRSEGVVESQVGGFASRPTLNDAFHPDAAALMQCCNAAGVRALYDLWRHAVEEAPGRAIVHLRFSVETPGVRVLSYEPSEGRLDVLSRGAGEVEIRLPQGVGEAVALVRDERGHLVRGQALTGEAGYVRLRLEEGQTAEVRYPLPARTAHYEVGAEGGRAWCVGHWRGETLVRVEPEGSFHPLYGRASDLEPAQPTPAWGKPIESL
ncbi:hypothetical protein Tter_2509 [Thermobaculum terrenum ATCC BAA-798]|uniref:Uncharacterized protein n=1 Tax=Thermobaculum terrenum (strain ATCC BAA-798 / CCMEE 7001 / YNP1) TaxID=525904 RepID=D1CI27_THET1|nr:hypothetical protein [Thermobaculum terrenum]ACZ43398.1 hypothetical protein Tter_2509 [Thermobaculum terrenum ATCC BAA-798]